MNIAVWYHCRLNGSPLIDEARAAGLMAEQMATLKDSGLLGEADEFHVGHNGTEAQSVLASSIAATGCDKVQFQNYPGCHSELPTIARLRRWAMEHRTWIVFYHHSKCATRADNMCRNWRLCMTKHLIWNWPLCIKLLESGVESVGCHWMTPEVYGHLIKSPFWGGNFWWCRASFLAELPAIKESADTKEDFFAAESWIGWGARRPSVKDFHAAWPNEQTCGWQLV